MTSDLTIVDAYFDTVAEDKKAAMKELRKVVKKNLPKGFSETMQYGMASYVVPHKLYPAGYHCDTKQALPFLSIAAQKNFIAVYHMGIYADQKLLDWFVKSFNDLNIGKLDMGKSCIRFKNPSKIPFDLIGQLAQKMTVDDWITMYEKNLKR